MKKMLGNMIGLMVAVPLAGAAMGAVGGIASMSKGMIGATQTMIGGGLLGHSAKLFKWK